MAKRVDHQEIVKKLLEMGAINFKAIGNTLGEIGPAFALSEEPWDGFCGTMRTFVHVYRLPGTNNPTVFENLGALQGATKELQG